MSVIRVLCIGDVVGEPGMAFFADQIRRLKETHNVDMVVVNGENSAKQGRGITPNGAQFFFDNGADVITTGNHIWYRREIYPYLDTQKRLLRPANFPSGAPGTGVVTIPVKGVTVAVINLQGRIFMREQVECPLKAVDSLLLYLKDKTPLVLIDYHAETTSEKQAMGFYVAGRASAVVGTHTHVQTADNRVLPGGTAYITDLGMVGALNSMLGMQEGPIIQHMMTQMPVKFSVATNAPFVLSGVLIEIDAQTGKAHSIERIRVVQGEKEA